MKSKTFFTRLVAFSAVLCMLLGLFACNDTPEQSSETPKYTVTFSYEDKDNTVKTKTVAEGETVQPPKEPEMDGYKFHAWMNLGTEFDFSTPITKDITLFAHWFDLSKEYRVVTGVEKYFQKRGTAIIKDSASGTTKRVTEGEGVTFIATPETGYKFSGWADKSGAIVSTETEYTIPYVYSKNTTDGEFVLTAKFVYSENVAGLENENNNLFWSAIQNTKFDSYTLEITSYDYKTDLTTTYYIAVNEKAGLAEIKICEQNTSTSETTLSIAHYYFEKEGEELKVIRDADGILLVEDRISKSTAELIKSLLNKREVGDITSGAGLSEEEITLQAQLKLYNFFKDSLSKTDSGLDFNVSVENYLREFNRIYNENKDKTVKQALYPNIKQAYDEMKKALNDKQFGSATPSFDNATLQTILDMLTSLGFGDSTNFDAKVYNYIDRLKNLCDQEGLAFDAEAKKSAYNEMKNLKLPALIEKLNEEPDAYGSLSDIPSDAQLTVAVVYALCSDYKLGDIAELVVTRDNIKGTEFDFTDNNANFENAFVTGNIEIENNAIRSILSKKTFGEGENKTDITVSLKMLAEIQIPEQTIANL